MKNNPPNESKCCEKCRAFNRDYSTYCNNLSCPCHTPDPFGDFLKSQGHKVIDVTPSHPINREWEKDFREGWKKNVGTDSVAQMQMAFCESFIRSLLQSEREKAYEEGYEKGQDDAFLGRIERFSHLTIKEIIDVPVILQDHFKKQAVQALRTSLCEKIEGEKKKPTQHPIACPDGMAGCAVFHSEMRISPEDKAINSALDAVLDIVRGK